MCVLVCVHAKVSNYNSYNINRRPFLPTSRVLMLDKSMCDEGVWPDQCFDPRSLTMVD